MILEPLFSSWAQEKFVATGWLNDVNFETEGVIISSSKEFKKAVSKLLDGLVADGVVSKKDKSRILRACRSK